MAAPSLVLAKSRNIKGFITALKGIKASSKQTCIITFDALGMAIRWEHESKCFQCSALLKSEAFHVYELREPEVRFGIKFEQLLVAFGLFTAGPGIAEVSLQYPGRDAELIIRSWHAQEGSFAHLSTVELCSVLQRLDEHWTGTVGSFIAPGPLLREAVDDFDWAGKSVRITVSQEPKSVTFLSSDQNLSLKVELPLAQLLDFSCQPGTHQATYSLRFLTTALLIHSAAPPTPTSGSTKVAMDAQGMLKVTHLLNLSDTGRAPQISHPLHTNQSQGPEKAPADCVLLFTMLPIDEGMDG